MTNLVINTTKLNLKKAQHRASQIALVFGATTAVLVPRVSIHPALLSLPSHPQPLSFLCTLLDVPPGPSLSGHFPEPSPSHIPYKLLQWPRCWPLHSRFIPLTAARFISALSLSAPTKALVSDHLEPGLLSSCDSLAVSPQVLLPDS